MMLSNSPVLTMQRKTAALLLVSAISLFTFPAAQAQSWNAPTLLNVNGSSLSTNTSSQPYAGIAIDGAGKSVSAWLTAPTLSSSPQIWSAALGATGGLTSPTAIYNPPFPTTYTIPPQVKVSAAGNATVVWVDSHGTWYADQPLGQAWTVPQLLSTSTAGAKFAMNSQGDAIVALGSDRAYYAQPANVLAVRRPAGGTWSSAAIVDTVPSDRLGWFAQIFIDSLALNDNGDALIGWENISAPAPCSGKGCGHINSLHVSRQAQVGNYWDNKLLTSMTVIDKPVAAYPTSRVLLDAQGHAGTFYTAAVNGAASYVASTQASGGQPWSPEKIIFSIRTQVAARACLNAATDASGNVTLLLGNTTQGIETVSGSLVDNNWTAVMPVPMTNVVPGQAMLAVGVDGASVIAAASKDPVTLQTTIQATQRPNTAGAWQTSTTLATITNGYATVVGVDVNASAKAVVLYGNYNPVTFWSLYAVNN
ncbi:MAG: hypothetical protein ABL933_15125 [Methyloglobulus sp.]|nr:hypothetical protein [Methyloglobulus sp.]